jgi:hypothetical protein
MRNIILVSVLLLAGCNEDKGVHKGQFEQACENGQGTLARVSPNEYTCTYPDGSVIKSQAK